MERYGLRHSLLLGYATQSLSVLLSFGSCSLHLRRGGGHGRAAYNVMYLSQALGAAGQPLILNNVVRVAGDWRARCARTTPPNLSRNPPREPGKTAPAAGFRRRSGTRR